MCALGGCPAMDPLRLAPIDAPCPAGNKADLVARLQAAYLAAPLASIRADLARLAAP